MIDGGEGDDTISGEDGNDVVLTAQQEVGFSITSRTVSESIGSFDIVVTAAQPFSRNVSIPLTIAGNAVNGADFDIDETHGTLDFLAGNTAATLSVGIIDDRNYEPGTESFTVTLGAAPEISLGNNSAVTVTIIDNDALPTVSMRNANRPIYVTEGHTYTVSASLSAPRQWYAHKLALQSPRREYWHGEPTKMATAPESEENESDYY